jgi:hypothetical protein
MAVHGSGRHPELTGAIVGIAGKTDAARTKSATRLEIYDRYAATDRFYVVLVDGKRVAL